MAALEDCRGRREKRVFVVRRVRERRVVVVACAECGAGRIGAIATVKARGGAGYVACRANKHSLWKNRLLYSLWTMRQSVISSCFVVYRLR